MNKYILYSIAFVFFFPSCKKDSKEEAVPQTNKVYTKIDCAPGPEDILLDEIGQRILISCNERRDDKPRFGAIQEIKVGENKSSTLAVNGLADIPFNPHGFDLQTIDGQQYIYIINHYKDDSNISSILKLKLEADHLDFVKEYKNSLIISPNDITVLKDGSFYFTNDMNSTDVTELITNPNGGSLIFCDGNNNWKKVDDKLGFPNGLYNEDNVLYLATSRNEALFTYNIQTDGSLTNRKVLSTINGLDNISPHGDDLIVAVHPNELIFALVTFLPDIPSPSMTYAINKKTGEAKEIFSNNGKLISASSTALIVGEDLYLSQVYGEFILKIENYKDSK